MARAGMLFNLCMHAKLTLNSIGWMQAWKGVFHSKSGGVPPSIPSRVRCEPFRPREHRIPLLAASNVSTVLETHYIATFGCKDVS